MSNKRAKTLAYHRVLFSEGYNGQLEELLKAAFNKNSAPRDRIVPIDLVSNLAFASLYTPEKGGVFLRVLEFETGATGVINFDTEDVDSIVEAFDHPDKKSFLKDQYFLLVDGNLILSCGLGNKAGTFSRCMVELCHNAKVMLSDAVARIADIPDRTTIAMVRKIGVKKVDFSLEGLMGELNVDLSQSPGARVFQMIFGVSEKNRLEVQKRANAAGRISLSRGRFEKEEIQIDPWLSEIGAEILEAGSIENYKIVLEDNREIKGSMLKRIKKVQLNRHANSVSHLSALLALEAFRDELRNSGEFHDE